MIPTACEMMLRQSSSRQLPLNSGAIRTAPTPGAGFVRASQERSLRLLAPRCAWVLCLLVGVLLTTSVNADGEFEKFIGVYEGKAVGEGSGELRPRDISVEITRKGNGFGLKWTAVMHKANSKVKRKTFAINFLPSKRPGLYSSAMEKNLFGQPVPMDPLKGDPYVWSKIEGDSLTVHALLIMEDGGYELQVYKRTLSEAGMDLVYTRIRDQEVLRSVTGVLTRVR